MQLTFTEYEAFAQAIRDASVELRMTAFDTPRWVLQHAAVGSLHLQYGWEGGGSIAEGATGREVWTFYNQSHPGRANGQDATASEVLAAAPGSEFCLSCLPKHDWVTVAIPTSELFPSPRELEGASRTGSQVLRPPAHVTRRFSSLIRRFLSAAESEPQLLESPVAMDAFRDELLVSTRELFARHRPGAGSGHLRWQRHVRSSVALAMSHLGRDLSVSDLARQSGIPERTLRTAFLNWYGVPPLDYLRVLRLNDARQRLLASTPDETTVTRVAFGLGFWDLGRFAGAYRRLYGERPSETLRRPARDWQPER